MCGLNTRRAQGYSQAQQCPMRAREDSMKKGISSVPTLSGVAVGVLVAGGSLAWAQTAASPQALAEAAYKATGMDGVQARTLVVSGSLQAWDPGESDSVADPLKPDWGN